MKNLSDIAQAMVASSKGILAADESTGTIKKRFDSIKVESTEDNRRDYRELLFTAPNISNYISGVILYDETIRQNASNGKPLREILLSQNIIPGIKVDMGAVDLAQHPGEKITEGLDGLRERLAEYASFGAQFTKWRAVITIGRDIPTDYCIKTNADALTRYAALSQEAGLVPMVEPETLMDHDQGIEVCNQVTLKTLNALFEELRAADVDTKGLILKVNMVLPGKNSQRQVSDEEVAKQTLNVLRNTVPADVPGIVFLSGGQSDEQAISRLNAINVLAKSSSSDFPWQISFSYGRGLQAAALKAWVGKKENVAKAQKVFMQVAEKTSKARDGGL